MMLYAIFIIILMLAISCLALCAAILARRKRLEMEARRKVEEAKLRDGFILPFDELLAKDRYISYSEGLVLINRGEALCDAFHSSGAGTSGIGLECENTLKFAWDKIERHNEIFVAREINRHNDFFDNLAKYPLDMQPRKCCVVDEDAGLVIAGAGSGKTSVIMAKVAYLVKSKSVKPEEILLISFTNKAADEMSERIANCISGGEVAAMTFHKFALETIKKHRTGRYDIADEEILRRTVHKALRGDDGVSREGCDAMLQFFAYYFDAEQNEADYKSLGDKISNEKSLDLNTLRSAIYQAAETTTFSGERVKSIEEVLIANFLFLNDIEYRYEMQYPKPYKDSGCHRAYRPDFYLPEYDIYIEHYGIDRNGEPPHYFSSAEKARYRDSMQWKRTLHREHGNKYIETFSWWNSEGALLERLADELKRLDVAFRPCNLGEIWKNLLANKERQAYEFEKLVAAFISLFKANGYAESHFDVLARIETPSRRNTKRQRLFLKIAKDIYLRYQKELLDTGSYDFNDLINAATEIVEGLPHSSLPYRYIIVDEYQDASVARMRLLKAAIQNTGAHLFCVGDDWQSIYRFAGSDISLFTNFGEYFGAYAEMKIANTYRNSQEIIDTMGAFVMRNPGQVRKELKSSRHQSRPIEVVFYGKGKDDFGNAMRKAVEAIADHAKGQSATVLLLGRTKYDMRRVAECGLKRTASGKDCFVDTRHPNIAFRFLTVHKSKGLEGDYVILLNATNGTLGFPSRIADDPVLQLVLSKREPYEFAEERRLFYVAITRTRNVAYILAPENDYSPFIDDLFDIGVGHTRHVGGNDEKGKLSCPKCKKGNLEKRVGKFGEFLGCSNYPGCDYVITIPVDEKTIRCPECDGFMVRRKGRCGAPAFLGCSNYPFCRHTMPLSSPTNAEQ